MVKAKSTSQVDSIAFENHITLLKRLPGIVYAYYELKKEGEAYNLVYHIEESFTIIPSVSIWTSANDEFSYKLRL